MSIIFFGSSKHSVIVEEALQKTFGLSLVVTVGDKLHPKTKLANPSPVKNFAKLHNIPAIATDKLTDAVIKQIDSFKPDFLVVADYGLILPEAVLKLPKEAPINVHHSLLPKYRGPSPAPSAILAGDKTTGVSIIVMNNEVDAGDILAQEKCNIERADTTDSLLTKINTLGGKLVCEVIKNFESYYKNRKIQDEKNATFTGYMNKADGYIDLQNPPSPEKLDLMIRAYFPWPGVWTRLHLSSDGQAKIIKLLPASGHPELVSGPSKVILQPEGKKPMAIKDFINGYNEGKELVEKLQLL